MVEIILNEQRIYFTVLFLSSWNIVSQRKLKGSTHVFTRFYHLFWMWFRESPSGVANVLDCDIVVSEVRTPATLLRYLSEEMRFSKLHMIFKRIRGKCREPHMALKTVKMLVYYDWLSLDTTLCLHVGSRSVLLYTLSPRLAYLFFISCSMGFFLES